MKPIAESGLPSKEIGLELTAEKTKYMAIFCHEQAEQIHNIQVDNKNK
jgi:hypothetical protein